MKIYSKHNAMRYAAKQLPVKKRITQLGQIIGTVAVLVPIATAQQPQKTTANDMTKISDIVVREKGKSIYTYSGGNITSGGRIGLLGNKNFMETPFSTISYTNQFITNRQAKDITDVIVATDPAVFASGVRGQNLESYSIRGFSSSINDVTVGGLFGVAAYYRSAPEMYERIEVLKGPSALLNGMPPKGSVGGTVNLVAKRAGNDPLTRLSTSYTSDSQFGGHIDIARRFGASKEFGIRFNGAYRKGETAVNNRKNKASVAALALDWRGEHANLSLDIYNNQDRVDGPTRGLTIDPNISIPKPPKPKTLLNPDWAFNHSKDRGIIARGEFHINEQLMAYMALGANKFKFNSTSAALGQIFNDNGDFRSNLGDVADTANRKSMEVGFRGYFKTGSIGHNWAINSTQFRETYNLNARRGVLSEDWVTNIYNPVWGPKSTVFLTPPMIETKTRLVSYGIADTLSFAQDKVQLTLGVRKQKIKTDSFLSATGMPMSQYNKGATTPAVALIVKATDNISVYTNYIEGLSQGPTAPRNAENAGEIFAPYKTKQKEIGLKLDYKNFAQTLSVYEIKQPKSGLDPLSNIFSIDGEQRNRGIEWGFFGTPLQNIQLMGGITYIDPKISKTTNGENIGKQAIGIPKWQAKLGVDWSPTFVPRLTLSTNATAIAKQYLSNDNSRSIPGHTIFDVGARYTTKIAQYPMTLRVNVNNISNKAYWAKPHYTSLGLGEPRTFVLSATMDF